MGGQFLHKRRAKAQRELDRLTVQQLLCKGWTVHQIACYMNLSRGTIRHDQKVIEARTLEAQIKTRSANVVTSLAEHYHALRTAYDLLEKSNADKVTHTTREGTDGKSATEVVETQSADPKLISEIRQLLREIANLKGAAAPVKIAETTADGYDLDPATLEFRRSRIFETLARLGVTGSAPATGTGVDGDPGDNAELSANPRNLLPE